MAVNAKPGADNYVHVQSILNSATGAALASITSVTASIVTVIKDANGDDQPGSEVSGSSVSLSPVASEDNAYEGFIPAAVALVHRTKYWLKIVTVGVIGSTPRTLPEHHQFIADTSKPRSFYV